MRQMIGAFTGLFLCLSLLMAAGYCDDASGDSAKDLTGRYRLYIAGGGTPMMIIMMLDTKTGKLWKISSDMAGTLKAEGVTVEGLAFSTSAADALNLKLKDISLDAISEKNRKDCRDKLVSEFSYALDSDKIDGTLSYYRDLSK